MKKLFLLLIGIVIVSCIPIEDPIQKKDTISEIIIPPITDKEQIAGVGDVFFIFSHFAGMSNTSKYELVIVELTQEKLGLQYSEYFFGRGGWMIKQGFNKRFDYAISDKVVRFKGYEFEIIGVEKGQIKYRRIK